MDNTITITQEEHEKLTRKASKWDALHTKIVAVYEDEDNEGIDLTDIGEMAASAFGYYL